MESASTPSLDRPTDGDELAEWQDSCATSDVDSGTQCSSRAIAATDSDLCSTIGKGDDTLVTCEFDCGPPVPRKNMVNKGNARSACWVCPPCFLFYARQHSILGFEA